MAYPKIYAGHATHESGLISIYAGVECPPGLQPGFFVVTRKTKRLNRKQFKRLDDTLRYGTITEAFVLLTTNDHKYFWRRLAVQLNRCYPKEQALELFIVAWKDTF